jgi:hypothetical protein
MMSLLAQPLNTNATDFYRERQTDLALRMKFEPVEEYSLAPKGTLGHLIPVRPERHRGNRPRRGVKLQTMRKQSWLASIGIIVVLAIAAILLGLKHENAGRRNASLSSTCRHDKEFRTYDEWRQSITFPYVGPNAKLQRVMDNYARVDVGSSKEEVVNAFGPPDFEEEMYPKEPNRQCLGYAFTYYFEKPEETVNELRDKRIEVFFAHDGRVNSIVGNVGLAERGRNAHRP